MLEQAQGLGDVNSNLNLEMIELGDVEHISFSSHYWPLQLLSRDSGDSPPSSQRCEVCGNISSD